MLKALIDANIIVTLITNREDPFLQDVKKLFQLCAVGRFDGYVAFADGINCMVCSQKNSRM